MIAYTFPALFLAQALIPVVDAALGYPKAGVDVGRGLHVPPAQSVTATYALVLKHPTLSLWAYPADATVIPIVGPSAISLGLPAAAALDGTWVGATPVGQ